MEVLRFLNYHFRDRSEPYGVASTARLPEFSQRPGMHQPVEDPQESPFTRADHELLGQMGIRVSRLPTQEGADID